MYIRPLLTALTPCKNFTLWCLLSFTTQLLQEVCSEFFWGCVFQSFSSCKSSAEMMFGPPLLNPLLKCSQLCDLMLFALSWDSFHPPRHSSASWIRQGTSRQSLIFYRCPPDTVLSSITFIIISTSSLPCLLRLWPGATASDSGYVGSSQKTWLVLVRSLAHCQTRFTITHLLPDQWRCKNCDISWCMDITFWIF